MAVTVDTTEKALPNRGARSLPFGGGCALLLGLFFICFGMVFVVGWWAAGWFRLVLKTPELVIGVCAVTFIIGLGVGLARSGVLGWRHAARAKDLAARHPDQPWFVDYPWDPRGTYEQPFGSGVLLVVGFVFLIMAPFNVCWRYALDPTREVGERLLVAGMLFIPNFFVYLMFKGFYPLLRDRRRYGRAYLAFDPFPFFLGETLAARVTAKVFAGQELSLIHI